MAWSARRSGDIAAGQAAVCQLPVSWRAATLQRLEKQEVTTEFLFDTVFH